MEDEAQFPGLLPNLLGVSLGLVALASHLGELGLSKLGCRRGYVTEMDQESGTAWDELDRFVTFSADFAAKNRDLCLLATIMSAEFSRAGNQELESGIRRIYSKYARHLQRVVEEGKREGALDPDLDTHHLAYVIIALHDGVLLSWQRSNELLDGHAFVKTFRRRIFTGIGPLARDEKA